MAKSSKRKKLTLKADVPTVDAALDHSLLKETEALKRLLVLLFVKLGTSSDELAGALQIDGSAVRRMVPSRKVKQFTFMPAK